LTITIVAGPVGRRRTGPRRQGLHTQNDAIIFATFYNATLPSLPEPSGAAVVSALAVAGLRRRRA
jgi:hypothetical protein